jgi:hypothetical protein
MCASERRQQHGSHRMASQTFHTTSHLRIASTPLFHTTLGISHCVLTPSTLHIPICPGAGLDFVTSISHNDGPCLLVSLRCCASRLSSSSSLIPSTSTLCSGFSFSHLAFLLYTHDTSLSELAFDISGIGGRMGNYHTVHVKGGFFPFVCVRVDGGFPHII